MNRPNPFRSAPAAKSKPRLSDAARELINQGKSIPPDHPLSGEIREHLRHSNATRFDLLEIVKITSEQLAAQSKRINALETALRHALAAVESDLTTEVNTFLDTDDAPSLSELEARADQHRKRMEQL